MILWLKTKQSFQRMFTMQYFFFNKEFNKLGIDEDEDNYFKAQMLLQKPLKKYMKKLQTIDDLFEDE